MTSPTPDTADTASSTPDEVPADAPRKPRAARRFSKTDAVLEAASERARLGVLEVAPEAQVGRHVSAVVEGERLVTHRFEAFVPGYGGWQWFATVARVARSKEVTVCEVGLLPSATSLIAPEWLPWSERVRPEDSQPDGDPEARPEAQQSEQHVTTEGPLEDSDGIDGAPVVGGNEPLADVEVPDAVASGDKAHTEAGEVPEQPYPA